MSALTRPQLVSDPWCCPNCGFELPDQNSSETPQENEITRFRGRPLFFSEDAQYILANNVYVRLLSREALLLGILLRANGREVTHEFLHQELELKSGAELSSGLASVYLCHARKLIEPLGLSIKSVWGLGHKMEWSDEKNARPYTEELAGSAA